MNVSAVVLTGASGGIGTAILRRLRADGYVVVAIDHVPGSEIAGVHRIDFDLGQLAQDPPACIKLQEQIHAACAALGTSQISGLVNNAAVQATGPANTQDSIEFVRSLDVNVIAPYLLCRLLYPALAESHGGIVNIGSIHARQTKAGFCAYATSKAALAGMTRALAVEWGSRVRVTSIEPAAIATPMLEAGFVGDPEARSRLASTHPANEIGDPELVARWVSHLLAEPSQFSNGAVINMDGGVSHRLHDPG